MGEDKEASKDASDETATGKRWGELMAAHAAERMRYFRSERNMSAADLARKTAELGYPIPKNVLQKIEGGYRRYVTIAELLVIARALWVSPIELIFPWGSQSSFESTPNVSQSADVVLNWLSGSVGTEFPRKAKASEGLYWTWRHLNGIEVAEETRRELRRQLRRGSPLKDAFRASEAIAFVLRNLVEVRSEIRNLGLVPPDLPETLQGIDEGQWPSAMGPEVEGWFHNVAPGGNEDSTQDGSVDQDG